MNAGGGSRPPPPRRRLPLREGAGLGEVQPRQRGERRPVPARPVRRRQRGCQLNPLPRPLFSSAPGPVGCPRCEAGHGDPASASPPLSSSSPCRRRSCRRFLLLLPAELLMARTSGGQARLPLHQPQPGEPAGARPAPARRTVRAARRTMGAGRERQRVVARPAGLRDQGVAGQPAAPTRRPGREVAGSRAAPPAPPPPSPGGDSRGSRAARRTPTPRAPLSPA